MALCMEHGLDDFKTSYVKSKRKSTTQAATSAVISKHHMLNPNIVSSSLWNRRRINFKTSYVKSKRTKELDPEAVRLLFQNIIC